MAWCTRVLLAARITSAALSVSSRLEFGCTLAVGVFATWPFENVNLEMMKDDRFLARASRLWGHVMEKATCIEGLPEDGRSSLRHLSLEAVSASLA